MAQRSKLVIPKQMLTLKDKNQLLPVLEVVLEKPLRYFLQKKGPMLFCWTETKKGKIGGG